MARKLDLEKDHGVITHTEQDNFTIAHLVENDKQHLQHMGIHENLYEFYLSHQWQEYQTLRVVIQAFVSLVERDDFYNGNASL